MRFRATLEGELPEGKAEKILESVRAAAHNVAKRYADVSFALEVGESFPPQAPLAPPGAEQEGGSRGAADRPDRAEAADALRSAGRARRS